MISFLLRFGVLASQLLQQQFQWNGRGFEATSSSDLLAWVALIVLAHE